MAKADSAHQVEPTTDPHDYPELQRRFGGRYVARRGTQVIADAETYDALSDHLRREKFEAEDVVIEYVDPPDLVSAY